jgi:RNA polymerase sigma-70 factor, ECF subfamily
MVRYCEEESYGWAQRNFEAMGIESRVTAEFGELMAAYQDGDLSAATALIHRLSPQLLRFLAMQRSSRTEAEDLLQETWMQIHQARHTYRAGEPVLPWLYAIARHVQVDHYRKRSRAEKRERVMGMGIAAGDSELRTGWDLAELLAPLPDSQREVIEMLKVAGMSLQEVARATSSSVGSVKQKAHRAYEKLRERLGSAGLNRDREGGLS